MNGAESKEGVPLPRLQAGASSDVLIGCRLMSAQVAQHLDGRGLAANKGQKRQGGNGPGNEIRPTAPPSSPSSFSYQLGRIAKISSRDDCNLI